MAEGNTEKLWLVVPEGLDPAVQRFLMFASWGESILVCGRWPLPVFK